MFKIKPGSISLPYRQSEKETASFFGYMVFGPGSAEDGCILTRKLIDSTLGIYRRRKGDTAYELLVVNSSVDDDSARRIADSMRTELVIIR